jgi:hypothetical protein
MPSLLLGTLELSLLPRFDAGVVVEAREHPPEQAQSRPPAPAIRVAVAREEPGRFPCLAHEGEDEVSDHERREDPLHEATLGWAFVTVNTPC